MAAKRPRQSYQQPGRADRVAIAFYVAPDVRDALKIHAIRTGSSVQELMEKAAEAIVAKAAKSKE